MRQMMYLIVMSITQRETEWAKLYERLVETKCSYDERSGKRVGKKRVIGRVAEQMIETMYALLKRDAEVLSKVPERQQPPPPILYDPEVHRKHREGQYRPMKTTPIPNPIVLLYKQE